MIAKRIKRIDKKKTRNSRNRNPTVKILEYLKKVEHRN